MRTRDTPPLQSGRATSPSTSHALIPDESHVLSCDFPELSHLQGHYVHSTLSRGNKPPHVLKPPHSQWSTQSPRATKSPKCHPNLQETPNLPNDNQISKRHEIFKCHQIFKSHQISLVPPNLPRANKCSSATKFAMIHHISKSHTIPKSYHMIVHDPPNIQLPATSTR